MPRPKKGITFRQFLQKKDYNLFRNFRYDKIISIDDSVKWVDEWIKERDKQAKNTQL
jgi:CRISPR/Cas system-associated protein endoribonuclease Cas2